MSKKCWKWGMLAMLLMLFGVMCTDQAQAASLHKERYLSKNVNKWQEDVNGDGKKETIRVQMKGWYGSPYFFSQYTISINGKKVLDQKLKKEYFESLTFRWFSCDKKNQFVQLTRRSSGGYVDHSAIYRYAGGKLTLVRTLIRSIDNADVKVVKAAKNQITVRYSVQPGETGRIKWDFVYLLRGSKLKLKSNTANVTGQTSYGSNPKKNQFITKTGKAFYTQAGGKKKAFQTKKNDVLMLRKVKIINKKMYLCFQKGKKSGWIRITGKHPRTGEWFYGVVLAG